MGNRNSVTVGTEVTENWTWCMSEVDLEEFGFDWIFKNYPAFSARKQIFSPIFKSPYSHHEWRLSIVPHSIINDVDYLGIYIQLVKFGATGRSPQDVNEDDQMKVAFRAQFSAMTQDGRVTQCILSQGSEIVESLVNIKGFPKFYKTSDFNRDLRPMNGPITFRCRIWIYGKEHTVMGTGSGLFRTKAQKTSSGGGGGNGGVGGKEEKNTKYYYHDDRTMIRDDKSALAYFTSLPSLEICPRGNELNHLLN